MGPGDREYRTVVVGGLLHDVGKLLQRGDFGALDVAGKHPKVSADFVAAFADRFAQAVDADLLRTLVQRHHEGAGFPEQLRVQPIADPHVRALAYVVSRADNLSSAERAERAGTYRDYKTARLASVFGRLELVDVPAPRPQYVRPRALGSVDSLPEVFPESAADHEPGELNALLTAFGEEFRALAGRLDWSDFEAVFTHLLAILQKYTWCLPSDTQEAVPDVSLYDHLKTVAAIAACLYQYHRASGTLDVAGVTTTTAPRFRLVAGDLSGIQDYLFAIASIGAGGAAKRLRARSLFIQLLAESVSHRLIRRLELPLANVLMSSGGRFYVLLPNTREASAVVDEVQREVDRWLLRELNGELGLNLASVEFGDDGFRSTAGGGFGLVLERLAQALGVRKRRRFVEALQGDDGWDEAAFLLPVGFGGRGACASCSKLPAGRDGLCRHCARDTELGSRLPAARYLAFYEGEGGEMPLVWHSATLAADPSEIGGQPYLVVRLNETDLGEVAGFPAAFRYLANYVPRRDSGEPLDFDWIAGRSRGRPMLGFLKADVDRLGEAFQFGLRREPPGAGYDTVSRLTTLSRSLDLFFSGWVERLVSREFADCYTVYSGGDDLLLVGPWERAIALARRVQSDFGRFTGHPGLTLSAGVAVTKPRFPLPRAAEEADEAVERSKQLGRNRVTVLRRTLGWDELARAVDEAELVAGATPSSAFLYSLLQYGEMWQRYDRGKGDVLALRFQPLLAYNVSRNLDPRRDAKMHGWVGGLIGLRPGDAEQMALLDRLAFVAGLGILRRRR